MAEVNTSLNIRIAFQRRSLALDQCRMVSYYEHERWVNHIFMQLHKVPPAGYSPVTIDQILLADVMLWQLVCDECRSGLSVTAAGVLPVEVAIHKHMYSPDVTYAFFPLPSGTPGLLRESESRMVTALARRVARGKGQIRARRRVAVEGRGKAKVKDQIRARPKRLLPKLLPPSQT